jgi:uncharacterized protein YndB with AHSA1/START domain
MPVYKTTFEINAGPNRVWKVLTTFDRYAEWNPQIPRASASLQEGASVTLRLALPGRPSMNLSATIEDVRPNELLTLARPSRGAMVLRRLSEVCD